VPDNHLLVDNYDALVVELMGGKVDTHVGNLNDLHVVDNLNDDIDDCQWACEPGDGESWKYLVSLGLYLQCRQQLYSDASQDSVPVSPLRPIGLRKE
jgi:hypothetical protein